jgi:putative ABC transport system ATP-binding protein
VTPIVQLIDVRKVIGDEGTSHPAVDGVTLAIEQGEFVAIMGPSGSGKSTLLNLIAGLDHPSSGRILVEGTDMSTLGEANLARFRRRRIGFIFQFFNLLNNLTVLENVLVPAELAGVKPREAIARARGLLDQLGLADKARHYPGRLAGGERQRVAIARALINRPLLVLADEPTGALDSRNGEQVIDQLETVNRNGQTILMVTHDAELAAARARRVVQLRDGRVCDDARLQSSPSITAPEVTRIRREEMV